MAFKSVFFCSLVFGAIPVVQTVEPLSGAYALGAAIMSLGLASYNVVMCRFYECCNDKWIVNNVTGLQSPITALTYILRCTRSNSAFICIERIPCQSVSKNVYSNVPVHARNLERQYRTSFTSKQAWPPLPMPWGPVRSIYGKLQWEWIYGQNKSGTTAQISNSSPH